MSYRKIICLMASLFMLTFNCCFGEEVTEYKGVTTSIVAGGHPWMDSSVVSRNQSWEQPSLKDDFFAHENFNWLRDITDDGTVTSYDNFSDVNSDVTLKIGRLLNNGQVFSNEERITKKAYTLVVDWDARDKLGLKPLLEDVRKIEAIKTMTDMDDYLIGEDGPPSGFLTMNRQVDFDNSKRYALDISPMGLTLGDSAEYSKRTTLGDRLQKANDVAIKKMMLLAGFSQEDAEKALASMYKIENALAGTVHTTAQQAKADYLKQINKHVTREQLQELAGPYPIIRMMDFYGVGHAELISLPNSEYLKKLTQIYKEENLQDLKSTLVAYRMLEEIEVLNSAANDIAIERDRAIHGTRNRKPDWVRGVEYVKDILPRSLSNLYAEQYCKKEIKRDIEKLVADVTSHYKDMLSKEDFLSESTRQQAIRKLESMKVKVVMPDKPVSGEKVKFKKCKSIQDVNRAVRRWHLQQMAETINGPVQHSWAESYTVNAHYRPSENSINIPAGILNGCFYESDFSYEEKLAGIGIVIGHEISHAFDTTGAQFDENGDMRNWWSDEDKATFDARAQRLIDYYDGITVFNGLNCSGELNKTEAIADMGAMKCMLAMAKERENFDYKKFFKHYAKLWRSVSTKERDEMQARTDSHPLDYLRVNVCVQQFEEFYEAFDIKETDNMYLAPEKRVLVW